jgi:hypothetical protein
MEGLLLALKEKGLKLAVISTLSPPAVGAELGGLREVFEGVMSGGIGGKLPSIERFARKYEIGDLSRIAFIDDNAENLLPVMQETSVQAIGFRGSGMYPETSRICAERGLPFAETVRDLEKLLGLDQGGRDGS